MALRHAGEKQYMCRKFPGTVEGRVCAQHEGRCVICDSFTDMAKVAKICDECGFSRGGETRCMVCGKERAEEKAYYCRHCLMLEKDRDGCPRIMNLSAHQQVAQVRAAHANPTTSGKGSPA